VIQKNYEPFLKLLEGSKSRRFQIEKKNRKKIEKKNKKNKNFANQKVEMTKKKCQKTTLLELTNYKNCTKGILIVG
jgi:hypothetical protein